jgi:hypothetical protein
MGKMWKMGRVFMGRVRKRKIRKLAISTIYRILSKVPRRVNRVVRKSARAISPTMP